ncbi:GNAT superfamily N-acetyltransferase [Arthrobacter sp. JUb119]|uniref:GNAT family N-acetyltransferase n=1 Tax=Micrococcaceae TaxID=1268 RepID=UPI000F92A490|nr:GNAT family N-acetyltransferase [Arthrobacter sp. JUb115]MCS3492792.1 GNAT superfamily N-acetyltransferase [Arthrobacter sp. JUb119]
MRIGSLSVFDDDALRAASRIEAAANEKARPGWQGIGVEARMLQWRAADGWSKNLRGAWEGSSLLGFSASMTHHSAPDTSWIYVWVDPIHQSRSIGSALVSAAEEISPSSVKRFVSSAYRGTSAELGALEQEFVAPLGYHVATTETVLELDLDSWTPWCQGATRGYEVSTHVNGVPEHLRKQVGQIKGLVDAQAPNGELGWSESAVSAEEYAQEITQWIAQGSTAIESIALDKHGDVAAWTCLVVAPAPESPSNIDGTLVLRQHRGHQLGTAVKAASLDAAKRLGTIHRVRTSSDDQNTWMHAINEKIGFVPVEHEAVYQKKCSPLGG